jgi:hypothetical protein
VTVEVTLTRLEKGRCAEGRANALCQENLVVFRTETGHHDTEDVKETADEDQPSRAKVIVQDANYRSLSTKFSR